jgi:hypothetical protein
MKLSKSKQEEIRAMLTVRVEYIDGRGKGAQSVV